MTAPLTSTRLRSTRHRSRLAAAGLLAGAAGLVLVAAVPASAAAPAGKPTGSLPGGYKNLVVIYEENH